MSVVQHPPHRLIKQVTINAAFSQQVDPMVQLILFYFEARARKLGHFDFMNQLRTNLQAAPPFERVVTDISNSAGTDRREYPSTEASFDAD